MLLAQIAGFPGAGKTRLCGLLRSAYGPRLTVLDTDDFLYPENPGAIETEINRILQTTEMPVVAIGTFGLEPEMTKEYPVFPSQFYWWLDVPLEVCMERALKRQIQACSNNFEGFVKLQQSKTTSEIAVWLSEYMNMKHRGNQWKDLKSIFLGYQNTEKELLFECVTEEHILDALSHAMG